MAQFEKGNPGGPGRPIGSKNKNYLSLNHWFEMINDAAEKLDPKERLQVAIQAANMLLPKVQALPGTPGDSVANAKAALEEIKALEEAKRDS